MNLKPALKFDVLDHKRSIGIFYVVIISIILLSYLLLFRSKTSNTRIDGVEFATIIFLFVAGLNSFRENFMLFLQNGLSRKTLFICRSLSIFIISTFMAFTDKIIVLFGKILAHYQGNFYFDGMFEKLYAQRYIHYSGHFLLHLEGFLFNVFIYSACTILGYFIAVLFYRMNKAGKISLSVGLPVGLFFVYPLVDFMIFHGKLSTSIAKAARFAFGFQHGGNPYFGMVTCILLFTILGGLSWLLVKKAIVKE